MHTYKVGDFWFNCNSDLSGDIHVHSDEFQFTIPGKELRDRVNDSAGF